MIIATLLRKEVITTPHTKHPPMSEECIDCEMKTCNCYPRKGGGCNLEGEIPEYLRPQPGAIYASREEIAALNAKRMRNN
jgi:hypothetical protein